MAVRRAVFGLAVFGLALAGALGAAGARAEGVPPVALVIGNAAYANLPKLPSCEMSANLVTSTLSRAGVKVTRLDNPSNARMGEAIAALGDQAGPGSRALMYVCGYVAAYGERAFLVPVEAKLEKDTDILSQGIVARLLVGSVAGGEAGLVLVDGASVPGQKGLAGFAGLRRSGEATHEGLAVADLGAAAAGSPAPLATALTDIMGSGVGSGTVELQAALRGLGRAQGMGRALVTVEAPDQASWLLGGPAPPVLGAGPPAVVQAEPGPPASPPPPPPLAPPAAAEAKPALAAPNPAERRRVQLGLSRLGYFKGRVNGVFGADTVAAIKAFQKDSEQEATGQLTTGQMQQLLQ